MASTLTEKDSLLFSVSISEEAQDSFTKLSSLLPFNLQNKVRKVIPKGLQEYLFLLNGFLKAVIHYDNNDLEKFDALVGETACQIRAIKLAIMKKKNQIETTQLRNSLKEIINKIELLLDSPKHLAKYLKTSNSLANLIEEEQLNFFINDDQLFLITAYFLTESKESNLNTKEFTSLLPIDKTNYNQLLEKNLSKKFLNKFIDSIKIVLSNLSVKFLINEVKKLNNTELSEIISDNYIHYHYKLESLPAFWTVKAVLHLIHKYNIPIILHAKFINKKNSVFQLNAEKKLIYTPSQKDSGIHFQPSLETTNHPFGISFQGLVYFDKEITEETIKQWKKTISEKSFYKIFLASAAIHPQYPSESEKQHLLKNIKDYQDHYNYGLQEGHHLKDPSTFLLRHISAQKIS